MLFSLMMYCIGYMTIKKVFEHFWKKLRSNGQLLIQCGGYGLLQKIYVLLNKLQELISSASISKTARNPGISQRPKKRPIY
jgi:precorrin-6B methylase 2